MRKRSRYRPKPVALNVVHYVLENISPVAKHESYLVDLKIKNSLAMQALLHGRADRGDMDALVAMSNVVEALVHLGFGKEYRDVSVAGRKAIVDIVVRSVKLLRYTPTGTEIQALNALMELHDAQMDVITVKDMENAIKYAKSLMRSGHTEVLPAVELASA